MGVVGAAELLGVRPCPPLDAAATSDAGTITGRFIHTASEILSITFDGSDTPIGVTPNHPFWDPVAQEFKQIREFAVGDQVLGRQGLATLTNIERRAGPVTVYNIETHGEHVYRVAAAGLLVHNAGVEYAGDKEYVYRLLDELDNVVYYGITNAPVRRFGEHVREKGADAFVSMEVVTEALDHGIARSIEGSLIRDRLSRVIGADDILSDDGVEAALLHAGLLNKNRGRIAENFVEGINQTNVYSRLLESFHTIKKR